MIEQLKLEVIKKRGTRYSPSYIGSFNADQYEEAQKDIKKIRDVIRFLNPILEHTNSAFTVRQKGRKGFNNIHKVKTQHCPKKYAQYFDVYIHH